MRLFVAAAIAALVSAGGPEPAKAHVKTAAERRKDVEKEIKESKDFADKHFKEDPSAKDLDLLLTNLHGYGHSLGNFQWYRDAIREFVSESFSRAVPNREALKELLRLFRETQHGTKKPDPRVDKINKQIVAAVARVLAGVDAATASQIREEHKLADNRIDKKENDPKDVKLTDLSKAVNAFGLEMMKLKSVETKIKGAVDAAGGNEADFAFIFNFVDKAKKETDVAAVEAAVKKLDASAKIETCIKEFASTFKDGLSLGKIDELLKKFGVDIKLQEPVNQNRLNEYRNDLEKEKNSFFATPTLGIQPAVCEPTHVKAFKEQSERMIKGACGSQEYITYIKNRKEDIKADLTKKAKGNDITNQIKKIDQYTFKVDPSDARCAEPDLYALANLEIAPPRKSEEKKTPIEIVKETPIETVKETTIETVQKTPLQTEEKTQEQVDNKGESGKSEPNTGEGIGWGTWAAIAIAAVVVVGGGLAYWFIVVKNKGEAQGEPKKRI